MGRHCRDRGFERRRRDGEHRLRGEEFLSKPSHDEFDRLPLAARARGGWFFMLSVF